MSKILNLPVNQVSFGNCSFGVLYELYKRGYEDFLFNPIGPTNLVSFDKVRADEKFISWMNARGTDFLKKYNRDMPQFKIWHINGSDASVSNNNTLFTCHELDEITEVEKNILNNQNNIIVPNSYSKQVFEKHGVTIPISVQVLGFDSLHFYKTNKQYKPKELCSFSIFGKAEKRKSHEQVIKSWVKKYGNNPKFVLNVCVTNPFFKPEDMNHLYASWFGASKPFNVNIIGGFLETLSELNDVYNSTDIVLDMSKGEAQSLPSFTCVGLGKHAVLHNTTGIKEWGQDVGAVLIEPTGKERANDGIFFRDQGDFNVGNWFTYDEDDFVAGMEKAVENWQKNPVNEKGLVIPEKYSWSKFVDKTLETLQ